MHQGVKISVLPLPLLNKWRRARNGGCMLGWKTALGPAYGMIRTRLLVDG